MNFHDEICEHLSKYKADVLGIKQAGLFRFRGKEYRKPHILPHVHCQLNILERYRSHFFSPKYAEIKRHKFFHHLNSSQALCINLFLPLIEENALYLFLKFLNIESGPGMLPSFEKESDKEEVPPNVRRTSFDFHVQHGSKNIFIEVKYTEAGFGRAKYDNEHRNKFNKIYLPLVEQSPFLEICCREEAFFLKHYQILRNLVHIDESSQVVLLFPSANVSVAREALYATERLLNDRGKAQLRVIYLDEFVSFLEAQCAGGPLDGYYQTFRSKYLPREIFIRPGTVG